MDPSKEQDDLEYLIAFYSQNSRGFATATQQHTMSTTPQPAQSFTVTSGQEENLFVATPRDLATKSQKNNPFVLTREPLQERASERLLHHPDLQPSTPPRTAPAVTQPKRPEEEIIEITSSPEVEALPRLLDTARDHLNIFLRSAPFSHAHYCEWVDSTFEYWRQANLGPDADDFTLRNRTIFDSFVATKKTHIRKAGRDIFRADAERWAHEIDDWHASAVLPKPLPPKGPKLRRNGTGYKVNGRAKIPAVAR